MYVDKLINNIIKEFKHCQVIRRENYARYEKILYCQQGALILLFINFHHGNIEIAVTFCRFRDKFIL